MRVAIVAGEASGDQLGGALIGALRARSPALEVRAVAGPKMRAAGCESLADSEELAVMGLFEVLKHLPRLWRLRARLVSAISTWRPDVFIGIDAPDFNLRLARPLKAAGLRTVQYVSPQIWAWRQQRARTMAASCDLVLCLLPFEPAFYADHGLQAEFVGHPLADQIPLVIDRQAARRALGLPESGTVIALLPGSRRAEVELLGPVFRAAAARLAAQHADWRFVAPMANAAVGERFGLQQPALAGLQLVEGQSRTVLQAADAALIASGTATLEALLCGCPMTVAYRFGALTAAAVRGLRLVSLPHFAMPNLLAGEALVPEFFQAAATPVALASAVDSLVGDAARRALLAARFAAIHRQLRVDGAVRAAEAVLRLVGQ
jgi:lipid-A-disaccharide synthase